MNCAGSHMASASFSNSAGLQWAAVKHEWGYWDWCRSFTPSHCAQAVTYGAICMAFGMDWRKGTLTFCDAFPAMSSPGYFFLRSSTCSFTHTHTPTPWCAIRLMQALVVREVLHGSTSSSLEATLQSHKSSHWSPLSCLKGKIKKHLDLPTPLFPFYSWKSHLRETTIKDSIYS